MADCNMALSVLYLFLDELKPGNGVTKKVRSQINGFINNGCKCCLCCYDYKDNKRYLHIDDKDLMEIPTDFRMYLYRKQIFCNIYNYIHDHKIQILYIRYTQNADWNFISFLKRVRALGCKVLIEIPTYPYDSEANSLSFKRWLFLKIEYYARQQFKQSCDYIVTTSDIESIFGVPTIRISNAVDPSIIPLREVTASDSKRFITVAQIAFWHGYDRIIRGLYNYYQNSNNTIKVYFTVVGGGDGSVIQSLKCLVKDLELQDYVLFTGPKVGGDLDALFNDADLAIGCLGCHRKNIANVRSLKNVEYAMRGIPFIYSEQNSDFDDMQYIIKVPSDESNIKIDDLVSFTQRITFTPDEIRKTVSHLTWDNQIACILQYLKYEN